MIGNPFSPAYARARQCSSKVDPRDYVTLNIALYGPRASAWSLTERDAAGLALTSTSATFGRSAVEWCADGFRLTIDDRVAPWGTPLRGTIRVRAESAGAAWTALDARGAHAWRPVAPHASVELAMTTPSLRWRGDAYVDANIGDEPLETAFDRWSWWRSRASAHETVIGYRAVLRDGTAVDISRVVSERGATRGAPIAGELATARTRWGMVRRVPPGARVIATLEDTPFYARSTIAIGERRAMHEELSLERLRARWVRALLPFRMRSERTR